MKSIEQLQAEQAAALAALRAEHEIAAEIVATGLPDPKRVHGFTPYPWAIYPHSQTLADALGVFRVARVVPYSQWRDRGCVSHAPEHAGTWENGPFACGIKVDTGSDFGPSAELQFFAQMQSGRVIAVRVGFGAGYIGACPPLSARRVSRLADNDGKRFKPNDILHGIADRCTYWATGSRENHSVLAHFCAESDSPAPGAECAHALAALQNLADTLKI